MTELDCFIIPKTSILGHLGLKPEFWVLNHQDFLKNHASPLYDSLTSSKKSEKSDETFLRSWVAN